MLQILLQKQFNSSCFQKFLFTGWKSAGLEKSNIWHTGNWKPAYKI